MVWASDARATAKRGETEIGDTKQNEFVTCCQVLGYQRACAARRRRAADTYCRGDMRRTRRELSSVGGRFELASVDLVQQVFVLRASTTVLEHDHERDAVEQNMAMALELGVVVRAFTTW